MLQSNLHNLKKPFALGSPSPIGPLTRKKQMRSLIIYLTIYTVALLLMWMSASPDLRQFALGLMLPGGAGLAHFTAHPSIMFGLYTAGGIALVGLGGIIWFGTGNIFAPPIGWVGGAIWIAWGLPDDTLPTETWIAALPLALIAIGIVARSFRWRNAPTHDHPASISTQTAADTNTTDDALSDADLARLRLLLDRALQPIEDFNGFEKLDQFQTAALRYQINFISYALSMVQARYMPAFKGYMHDAQDNLTSKQQDPRIWGYWKLENIWGNLRFSGDPIAKDNIMYSGFVAAQLMYRIKSTSYPNDAEDVTLRCQAGANTLYQYTLPQIIEQLTQQYHDADFGLLPCEPNWIYPLCNAITATAIRAYDRQFDTDHWDSVSASFKQALETEFTNAKGQLVPFRSSYTGFAPMAVGGAVMQAFPCFFLNPIFPDIAQRHWRLTQHYRGTKSWRSVIWPVDVGNYGLSRAAGYAATAVAAQEMADTTAARDLLMHLDQDVPSTTQNGITYRAGASLWAHANEVMAHAAQGGALDSLVNAPRKYPTPYIRTASYPDVLIAKAIGSHTGLSCVLVPGRGRAKARIILAGLVPDAQYRVRALGHEPYQTTSEGELTLTFELTERLALNISKLHEEHT